MNDNEFDFYMGVTVVFLIIAIPVLLAIYLG
jgi:hypothetical protein